MTYINGKSGKPIWTLGGKHSNFTGEAANGFRWQHHARFVDDSRTQLTLFDNHMLGDFMGCDRGTNCTRGRHLELDYGAMEARVVQDFYHPEGVTAGAMGGVTRTPAKGNTVVGWGRSPTITEHTPDGRVAMDIQYLHWDPPRNDRGHYRVYKGDFVAHPDWSPEIAWLSDGAAGSRIYVSWNGATELKSWELVS